MRHPLTRERVCLEALALVDADGLEALTMRKLGARLGVEAMSLYKHVHDKADLLDMIHAAVLGDLEPEGGSDGQWRSLLGGLARALRSALLRHPHVLPLFTTRPVTAPEAVATVARVQEALARDGFRPAEAERAIYVVGMFTIGHVIFEKTDRRAHTFNFGLDALLDGIERDHHPSRRKNK